MIDAVEFKKVVESYYNDFTQRYWDEEEGFKWKAVKAFSEKWDIDSSDFSAMLKAALKEAKPLVEDDDFSFDSDEEATLFEVYEDLDYAEVEVDGKLYPFQILEMIDEALQDGGMNPIEEYSAVEKSGDYWEAVDGMSLTQCIRSWRWWELKNSIEHNRTAIADFIGANPGSATYVKVLNGNTNQTEICDMLDKAEAQMPEDKFMQFFNKYDNPNIWDIN